MRNRYSYNQFLAITLCLLCLLMCSCSESSSMPTGDQHPGDANSADDGDQGGDTDPLNGDEAPPGDSGISGPHVTVTYPAAGDRFFRGATIRVQWESAEVIGSVDLEYTLNASDSDPNWISIATDAPNLGWYEWTLPDVDSTDCQVRVTSYSNAIRANVSDTSAGSFEIGDVGLLLTAPQGDNLYFHGETVNITWTSRGLSEAIDIAYTTNASAASPTWHEIAMGQANDGLFVWTVPAGITSSDCKIRVAAEMAELADQSDASFEIAAPGAIYYVKPSGSGDGSNWSRAFGTPQDALAVAQRGDQIWVAAGTYKPGSSDRGQSFEIETGVRLYGGFAGTETSLQKRDFRTNKTILSGDINTVGVDADNSFHVVVINDADDARVDGFTVTKGYADGAYEDAAAAGMMISNSRVTIANCLFVDNVASLAKGGTGGGIRAFSSHITIEASIFENNEAPFGGGLALSQNARATISNAVFFDNLAVGGGGAVSAFSNSDIDFVNCTLTGNRADTSGGAGDGGAFWSGDDCDSSMVNTILTDNSAAGTGDQLALEGSATNSVKHCFIEGSGGSGASWDSDLGVDNGGNIDRTSAGFTRSSNPIGSDGIWATSDDGLRLSASSPCRDSGNDAAALLLSADITGRNRTVNAVDIGAYESQ